MYREKKTGTFGIISLVLGAFLFLGLVMQQEKETVIDLDGKIISTTTRAVTIRALLAEQGIAYTAKDLVIPAPGSLLQPEAKVEIKRCVPIRLAVDGRIIEMEHHTLERDGLAKKAGITLDPLDEIRGNFDKNVVPLQLTVVRIKKEVLEQEEVVPFNRQYTLDANLKEGQSKVVQEGASGLAQVKYLVHYENGEEKNRQVLEKKVIAEPQEEITAWGTRGTIKISSRSMQSPRRMLQMEATAYTHTGNVTFTGVYPRIGTIAVDPKVIPLGTRLWIEGYGYGIAQDTGGLIKGNIIDLFMDTEAECFRWGRRQVKVYILE